MDRRAMCEQERWACVHVPALPLQLLLRDRPAWRGKPAAVVAHDRPQAPLLWVNEAARTLRVLPGMRYAAALSLARSLHAGTVAQESVEQAVAELTARLRGHGPFVEPWVQQPGMFWLDAGGLLKLHDSLQQWAQGMQRDLRHAGFASRIAVGFTRFGTHAVAQARSRGLVCFESAAEEREAAGRVPLARLALDVDTRDLLQRLRVETVAQLLALRPVELLQRFGPQLYDWHRLATGSRPSPLQPVPETPPVEQTLLLDEAEQDVHRLLFSIKRHLHPLLAQLAARQQAVCAWYLIFRLEPISGIRPQAREARQERICIRPAAPTLDEAQLLELARLRLEARPPQAGVTELRLHLEGVPVEAEQLRLFLQRPRRDLAAADRALARLRAELGSHAVCVARLREAHLPEARFVWEPLEHARLAKPSAAAAVPRVVRRLRRRPQPVSGPPRHGHDGWWLDGFEAGTVSEYAGPYLISGGWWKRTVHREYALARTQQGELYWIFYDARRHRWWLQGSLE